MSQTTRACAILFAALFLGACATTPPPPPPPPKPQFFVPAGTEFVSDLFGYSQAVKTGPWVTISAQPGFDIEKRGFPEDFRAQVTAAFKNLELSLKAAGAKLSDVTQLTSYMLDTEKFNDVVDVKGEFFGEHKPTWTVVGVKGLPLPQMQFQVSAVAYVPPAEPAPAVKKKRRRR